MFFKKKTLPLQCLFPVASGFKLSGLVFLWVERDYALVGGAAEVEVGIAQGKDEGTVDEDIDKGKEFGVAGVGK